MTEQHLIKVEFTSDIPENPYINSTLVSRLKERQKEGLPLRIAFLDIDSTLTGNPKEARKVRKLLEEKGYAVVFVTSRTEEMVMSKAEFQASEDIKTQRSAPHLAWRNGKRVVGYADEVEGFEGLYDGDVIAGTTGSEIYILEKSENGKPGGYKQDKDYDRLQQRDLGQWRQLTLPKVEQIIQKIDPDGKIASLASIEEAVKFKEGETDVAPPNTRIQVNFEAPTSEKIIRGTGSTEGGSNVTVEASKTPFAMMQEFQRHFQELEDMQNVRLTDDSNPEKGRFAWYITPNKGYKARAAEYIIQQIVAELNVTRGEIETLMVGDSFPDVNMGLYGGTGTKATFLIVGGSRLKQVFTNPSINEFSGVKMGAIKRRLTPTPKQAGYYEFKAPILGSRTVIVGDKAFPRTIGPETLSAYLEKQ